MVATNSGTYSALETHTHTHTQTFFWLLAVYYEVNYWACLIYSYLHCVLTMAMYL